MTELANLRNEQLSLLIGIMIGQISALLNNLSTTIMTPNAIYKELKDIHDGCAMQIQELYYKGNKP